MHIKGMTSNKDPPAALTRQKKVLTYPTSLMGDHISHPSWWIAPWLVSTWPFSADIEEAPMQLEKKHNTVEKLLTVA